MEKGKICQFGKTVASGRQGEKDRKSKKKAMPLFFSPKMKEEQIANLREHWLPLPPFVGLVHHSFFGHRLES